MCCVGLTGSLEKKDNSGNEIEELRKQEQQLQQDLKDAEKHNQELSAQCQESQNNVEKLKETKIKLQEDKDRLDNETTVILPKRRYCQTWPRLQSLKNIFHVFQVLSSQVYLADIRLLTLGGRHFYNKILFKETYITENC